MRVVSLPAWERFLLIALLLRLQLSIAQIIPCYCPRDSDGTFRCKLGDRELAGVWTDYIGCSLASGRVNIGPFHGNGTTPLGSAAFAALHLPDQPLKSITFMGLDVGNHVIDAMQMAGLPALDTFNSRLNMLSFDICGLAALPRLRTVVLKCGSRFTQNNLVLGKEFVRLMLVGCGDLPMQYHCVICNMVRGFARISAKDGPPSSIKYWRFMPTDSKVCSYGPCSDNEICYNNAAYREAKRAFELPPKAVVAPQQRVDPPPIRSLFWHIVIGCAIIVPAIIIAVAIAYKIVASSASSRERHRNRVQQAFVEVPRQL